MSTSTRCRGLYGLRRGGTRFRQQARLLGEAFTDAGVSVDFLIGGPGKPRLLTAEALHEDPRDVEGLAARLWATEAQPPMAGPAAGRALERAVGRAA